MTSTTYITRSKINPAMILCTDGQFHPENQTGPGGWSVKTFKTESGAQNANNRYELNIAGKIKDEANAPCEECGLIEGCHVTGCTLDDEKDGNN